MPRMASHAASTHRAAHYSGHSLSAADRAFLTRLARASLQYFVDNQLATGLFLDRQANHGPRRMHGLASTAATGMGFIALGLAAAEPHYLLSRTEACRRIGAGLRHALERLPCDRGVLPHFVDSATGAVRGVDRFSTLDSSWLVAGALWAAAFLQDRTLEELAGQLYERVEWRAWTAPAGPHAGRLLLHGKGEHGRLLDSAWDRLNGETIFMYLLAAGADPARAIEPDCWTALRPFYGTVGGLRFNNADLGLFVFQYGLDLVDLVHWQAPGKPDLWAEARLATLANRQVCRDHADRFATYRRFWGLSAGDGPAGGWPPHAYRSYSPSRPLDGTAHLTASLASVAHAPEYVLENLYQAQHDRRRVIRGAYGFSSVNLDRRWIAGDMVGIDAGAAALALDNFLMAGRARAAFHQIPCVAKAVERLGFQRRSGGTEFIPFALRSAG